MGLTDFRYGGVALAFYLELNSQCYTHKELTPISFTPMWRLQLDRNVGMGLIILSCYDFYLCPAKMLPMMCPSRKTLCY